MEYTYISSQVNDGEPHYSSPMEDAIGNAFVGFHKNGTTEWQSFKVEKLNCDSPEAHYPNVCWHYKVTISS